MRHPEIEYDERIIDIFSIENPYEESRRRKMRSGYFKVCWYPNSKGKLQFILQCKTTKNKTHFDVLIYGMEEVNHFPTFNEAHEYMVSLVEKTKLRKLLS